jgi:hypothetical protein
MFDLVSSIVQKWPKSRDFKLKYLRLKFIHVGDQNERNGWAKYGEERIIFFFLNV